MQQLRLFPREHRLAVALVTQDAVGCAPTLRRLRRSRRLDAQVVSLDELRDTARSRRGSDARPAMPNGQTPAAVVVHLEPGSAEAELLAEVARLMGPVPLVVVTPGGAESVVRALEAGAEEAVTHDELTAASLERAVLSSVHRRVAGARAAQRPTDPLTGLATRAVLTEELPRLLSAAGRATAVLYCDLDRFKAVNDTHGHSVGDRVLIEAAQRLLSAVRTSDLVVRIGGDEFVVVVGGPTGRIDALADDVAGRILASFGTPFAVDGHAFAVGVSIGVATHRAGEGHDALVVRADRALYLAKQRGRSRVARYDEQLDLAAAQRATATELLREGLRRDLLEVEVHPVIDSTTSRLAGHYYRAGWGAAPRQVGRPAPVRAVQEVALEGGLAIEVFRWTLRRALDERDRPSLTVGTARRLVEMPRAVLVDSPGRIVTTAAGRDGCPLDQLVMLVDEADMADSTALRAGLLELARLGVRVAVSGYGATEGSLGLLERHAFEAVWVDRQLTDGIHTCAVRQAKLEAICLVATALGQQVVVDRPRRAEDAATVVDLAPVLVVDRAVDLTTPGLVPVRTADVRPLTGRR